jgi:hypothetical protein
VSKLTHLLYNPEEKSLTVDFLAFNRKPTILRPSYPSEMKETIRLQRTSKKKG